ncbi:3-isopropylmalate dehydratase small subunit [Jiella mangrovi]|uniref:3-isopropylmalate dehydratase small subunit n=1 Tax=Jiella mangrovi TaxID=2821407 RepID=A0ABS4BMH7_9HYPH|nr:3-isopropylmalate dehydratase small subunit [Jiella mangrovi]MBP0617421.1 3-isopropylmalate dehydratase small subunit [Jiella mangrovi]
MQKFTKLSGVAAPLPETNVDTDVIFPARFLLLPNKTGLGAQLFHERRMRKDEDETPPFVLDTPPYDRSEILVAGRAFGTGSSREQAVWALADFGIRCVIAPSFGEIFFANCFKNGILPIVLSEKEHAAVLAEAIAARPIVVDLESLAITLENGRSIGFEVEAHRRRSLLLGLDEIGSILIDDAGAITAFETRQRETHPWLFLNQARLGRFGDEVE